MCVSSVSNAIISESVHTQHTFNQCEWNGNVLYFASKKGIYEMKYSKSCRKKEHTKDAVQSCAINSTLIPLSLLKC